MKGRLVSSRPGREMFIGRLCCERVQNVGVLSEIRKVMRNKFNEAKETSYFGAVLGDRPGKNLIDFGWISFYSISRDLMA